MANYTNVFGDNTIPPSGNTYRLIPLTGHTTLHWPDSYEGEDFIAKINNVTGSASNWHLTLPDATMSSTGRDLLIRNVGLYAFQVNNNAGVPVATLQPGDVKYLYLTDNTTAAGVWQSFTFGAGASSSDASQLQGPGLIVLGSQLAVNFPVYPLAADVTATFDDRTKMFVFTGGSNTLTLPSVLALNDGWFIGVRNSGNGQITINASSGATLDGASSKILAPGESLFVVCNGTLFYTLGHGRSSTYNFTQLVKDVSAGGTFTLTSGEAANKLLKFTGTPASAVTIVVPDVVSVYYIQNAYSGDAQLTIKTNAGSGVTLTANNQKTIVSCDGVNVISAVSATVVSGGGSTGAAEDGSAGAPSFTFALDTDLGFYRISDNTIGLAAGGSEVARWGVDDQSVQGNFGVGTSSPTGKLDVRGRAIISGGAGLAGTLPTGSYFQLGGADGEDTRGFIDAYGSSNGPMLTFRSSRGTASAPTAVLENQRLGTVNFRGRGATAWSLDMAGMAGEAAENWTDSAQGTHLSWSTTAVGGKTRAVKMRLSSEGYLSVGGDFEASTPLHVLGRATFSERVVCESISVVRNGIPLSALNSTDQGGIIQCQAGSTAEPSGYWGSLVGQPFIVWDRTGTDIRFYVGDSTNGVWAWAYNSLSDERLKSQWDDLPYDFIERLATVKSGEYTLIQSGERAVGVGAQSLMNVMPAAVHIDKDGMLSVSYGNAALAACVRLAKELIDLRAQVNSLIGNNK